MLGQFRLDRRRRVVVGELQLHRLEAASGRRGEPLDQRPLGEQIGDVGGETWHGVFRLA
jgi:hypothetical protein